MASKLAGTVPDALSVLTKLENLHLKECNLAGGVPEGYGSLSNLREL